MQSEPENGYKNKSIIVALGKYWCIASLRRVTWTQKAPPINPDEYTSRLT